MLQVSVTATGPDTTHIVTVMKHVKVVTLWSAQPACNTVLKRSLFVIVGRLNQAANISV